MTSSRSVRALCEGEEVHLLLPGVEGPVVLSAAEAVDLLERLRSLGPVLTEETARVSDRLGQGHDSADQADRD